MGWQVFQLLSQMLGGKDAVSTIATASAQNLWPAVLTLSSYSLVTPNLYWTLSRNQQIWHSLPTETQEYLSNIFELNTLRNETIISEVRKLIHALNAQNITPLILKNTGELLSQRTPHTGYRMQTDIDLMVIPEALDKAYAIIQQQGYCIGQEQRGQHGPILNKASAADLTHVIREYQHHQHLPPLIKEGAVASVELHRHAYGPRFQKKFALHNLFEQAQLKHIGELQFLIMSPQQRQQHLVYHSYIGDGFQARSELPLRAACDWLHTHNDECPNPMSRSLNVFDVLVKSLLLNEAPKLHAAKCLYWGIKLRHSNRIIGAVLAMFGQLKHSATNIMYNPQKLRKRWRLWFG